MQRLFTIFPGGWPGASLLLLRTASASAVIVDVVGLSSGGSELITAGVRLLGAVPAIALLLGIWTPLAGFLDALVELLVALLVPGVASLHVTRAAIGLALCGLGPGAWSLDSFLYGRKRINI
jgi:hypothetical protein